MSNCCKIFLNACAERWYLTLCGLVTKSSWSLPKGFPWQQDWRTGWIGRTNVPASLSPCGTLPQGVVHGFAEVCCGTKPQLPHLLLAFLPSLSLPHSFTILSGDTLLNTVPAPESLIQRLLCRVPKLGHFQSSSPIILFHAPLTRANFSYKLDAFCDSVLAVPVT